MKKTRIFAMVCAICLLFGLFVGCGKSDNDLAKIDNSMEDGSDSEYGKLKKVDPFERISFVFFGKHGEATVKDYAWILLETKDGYKEKMVAVEIPENNGSLKNGDKLKVSFKDYDSEDIAKEYGVKFTRTEAEIKIHGLVENPDYVAGKPKVIDLSDYIAVIESRNAEYPWVQFQVDYKRMVLETREYAREDAIGEEIGSENTASCASSLLRDVAPYNMICENYDYGAGGTYTDVYGDLKKGDQIVIDWEEDTEILNRLKKLLNVEFKNEKYTYTVQAWWAD